MIRVLDGETRAKPGFPSEYALQPWRVRENAAEMFCIGFGNENGSTRLVKDISTYTAEIQRLKGQLIYGYNLTFDVAWLVAHGVPFEDITAVTWVDVALLWKWVDNSQIKELKAEWSLADAVKKFCGNEPWAATFIAMKKQDEEAGANTQYWENRARFDCVATAIVAERVLEKISGRKLKSAMIECACIPQIARSWVKGIMVDSDLIEEAMPPIKEEMATIEFRLGVSNQQHTNGIDMDAWVPSKILRSPVQLGELLFKTWHLPVREVSEKTGRPSTDKATLTYLADDNDVATEILRWRKLNTQLTKYVQSPLKAQKYLGSAVLHPSPRLFSTYTGRMTYTSKQQKKFPIGMALHQWPREKEFRAIIIPPKGFKHVEYDAKGQESRLMAEQSGDAAMMNVFIDGLDFHSYTGANISGMSYEKFMEMKAEGDEIVTGTHGLRYQGKFCIAEGQLVDTNQGPMPIEDVTILDKVWDGDQYVSHDGVICNGIKDVIFRDGVLATADHKVLTDSGWKQLGEVSDGDICRKHPRLKRNYLRAVVDHIQSLVSKKRRTSCGVSLSVRKDKSSFSEQSGAWKICWLQKLQIQIWTTLSRNLKAVSRGKRQMSKPKKPELQELWSTRNKNVLHLCSGMVQLLDFDVSDRRFIVSGHRSEGQQRTLPTRESSTGVEAGELIKHTEEPNRFIPWLESLAQPSVASPKKRLPGFLLRAVICSKLLTSWVFSRTHFRTASNQTFKEGKTRVYDIVNAGPRHRFTLQGRVVQNCNLSNNYRIGSKKLRVQSRVQYGMNIELPIAQKWQSIFHRSFPGIKNYWKHAIKLGKEMGYAETYGGRQFKLQYWSGDWRWGTESSAINFPIQGSGADQKELAIWQMQVHFPEFIFWFDLHDGIHYLVPNDTSNEELLEARDMLDALDYKKWWGVDLKVPLKWDCQVGKNWAELEEL